MRCSCFLVCGVVVFTTGRFLFLFINDIPAYFDSSCDPVKLTQWYINCLLYADDLILVSNSAEGLQNCMDKLSTFYNDWEMNINLDKTKTLVFSSGSRQKKLILVFKGTILTM